MSTPTDDYLDGNAAAGQLSEIFAADVTVAEAQCAHCGATRRFAEAHVYVQAPGLVARCAACQGVVLRLVRAGPRALLDVRGLTYIAFEVPGGS